MINRMLARFAGASVIGPDDFDAAFYRCYYADLHVLKSVSALRKHYQRHGKAEGRFPSLAAARAHFERSNGPAPDDFDVGVYQQLNPDLAKVLSHPVQYELHFLEFGRFENRPWNGPARRPQDAWQALLNLHDFNLMNEHWLPPGGVDRDAAIAWFEAEGIERLAPLARAWVFDPTFYRAQYGLSDADEVALYRDWLSSGFRAGRAPNEIRAIFPFVGGRPYPTAFDWQRFMRAKGLDHADPFPAKIRALEMLFEAPLDGPSRACVSGPEAGRLFEAIGDYHLIRARYKPAAEVMALACASPTAVARTFVRLGDALKALGENDDALGAYRRALSMQDCPIWALVHATNLMLGMRMFREALRLVERESERFRPHELFAGFVDEVAGTVYRAVAETMHSMISDDKQDVVLDTYADARLGEITAFLETTKLPRARLKPSSGGRPRIVILACLDLAQCTFYRVEQKRRLLEAHDVEVEIFDFGDPTPFMSALPGAAAAIFYRVPSYPKIVEAILYARSISVDTFYDIDDLVFTRDFPDSYESYERQISRREYLGLCHGVALYRQAIALCDGAIVSTRPLGERIAPLVRGGRQRVFVVPNGLDDRSETAMRYSSVKPDAGENVSIFYGSGTKAHNRDFSDIVAPALLEVLSDYPRCRLVVAGYLRLDERFDAFRQRITRFPFVGDLNSYWAILATCDINISVLHAGPIADCKSEIKWLEAAMLGIPSIVSATQTYLDVLTDGVTGLLARDGSDWLRHLSLLIESRERRRTIGAAARKLALREYGPKPVAAKLLSAVLGGDLAPRELPRAEGRRRRRLLICNVLFAPQSQGGATRVVEDNVAQLVERYGETFEIAILSTYKGLKAGELRVDSHLGCVVYRIGTPIEINMDWRPFNDDEILPPFKRVLEVVRPDLVHFHCIQRLTASIVEETLRAGIPYIVTVHDAWWISDHQFLFDQNDAPVEIDKPFDSLLPAGVSRPESLQRRQRLTSLLNAGIATLAVSPSFTDFYRRAGIDNAMCCENGLGPLRPPRMKTTPKNRLVLGHIGGRAVHKGAALIEIVLRTRAFRNLSLLMIEGELDTGEERYERWGSTPVTLRAPVEREAVDELYSQIDVLLAPSLWPESYGLVSREALFHRTWVVAGRLGAMAQNIADGANGFAIDTSDTRDLAELLARLDDDIEHYKTPPAPTRLRQSCAQVDELAAFYQEITVVTRERIVSRERDRTAVPVPLSARG